MKLAETPLYDHLMREDVVVEKGRQMRGEPVVGNGLPAKNS